jgi:hypothetical protein
MEWMVESLASLFPIPRGPDFLFDFVRIRRRIEQTWARHVPVPIIIGVHVSSPRCQNVHVGWDGNSTACDGPLQLTWGRQTPA